MKTFLTISIVFIVTLGLCFLGFIYFYYPNNKSENPELEKIEKTHKIKDLSENESTPERTLKHFFQYVKKGEMTKVKQLTSGNYMDAFDEQRFTNLFVNSNTAYIEFVNSNTAYIETELVKEANLKALVKMKLKTPKGLLTSSFPVELVFRDGNWMIYYTGWNRQNGFEITNYH
jgi:hypothetical protein